MEHQDQLLDRIVASFERLDEMLFDKDIKPIAPQTVLMVFNDVILRVAIEHRLSAIDLRLVCSSTEDYANPIEPASPGGAKIARAIVNLVSTEPIENRGARIVSA